MRLRTTNNYFIPEVKSENFSKKDIIDRTGYVPLDMTYYNMMLSGLRLNKARDDIYSYEYNQIKDSFENGTPLEDITLNTSLQKHYNSKLELDSLLKDKISKYKQAVSFSNKVSNLKEQFEIEQRIKREREDAINDYVARQKELKPQ